MDDTAIRRMLADVGIPKEAMRTTLTKQGRVELKERLACAGAGAVFVVEACSARQDAYTEAELLFYLVAKELALLGRRVVCLDLVDYDKVVDFYTDSEYDEAVAEAEVVCIRNFYEPTPKAMPEMSYHLVASRITRAVREDGKVFVLLSYVRPTAEPLGWWPPSFEAFIGKNAYRVVT